MQDIIPIENITSLIYLIRGKKVMLDRDLAHLYQVETKALKQAVRRNTERFPEDFMFELSNREFQNLRSQIVTSSWGGARYRPMAFTELRKELEDLRTETEGKFEIVFKALDQLLNKDAEPKQKIGFKVKEELSGYEERNNR